MVTKAACTGVFTASRHPNQQGQFSATTITLSEHTTGWIICRITRVYTTGRSCVGDPSARGDDERGSAAGGGACHFLRLRSLAVMMASTLASNLLNIS